LKPARDARSATGQLVDDAVVAPIEMIEPSEGRFEATTAFDDQDLARGWEPAIDRQMRSDL
jgi:hypothetical protein